MNSGLRKSISLVLTGMIAASLFAGCTKKENPQDAATETKNEVKPTLKALMPNQKEDYNTYPVSKVLEEKTGYKVEYDMLPQDAPEDKLNLIMASSQGYDFITVPSGLAARYADYARQGALTDMDPIVQKYGNNIKQVMSKPTLDGLRIDNKLYAIGSLRALVTEKGNVDGTLLVRQDWMEKLNLKEPKTIDDFVAVLQAFKDKDPGGMGNKTIPLCLASLEGSVLSGAFGITADWNAVDGKVLNRIENPNFKDYLLFMTDLYKKGLLDHDFATNKAATTREKFSSGRAGMMNIAPTDLPTVMDALQKNVPGSKVKYISPIQGKDGKSGVNSLFGYDRITFIPKVSKNADHVIKYFDMKLDKDLFKLYVIGEEGKHYTVKDGEYSPILPTFFDERGNSNNYLTGVDEKNYPKYWQARIKKDMRIFDNFDYIQKNFVNQAVPNIKSQAPFMTEFSKYDQSLNTIVSDYTTKVIMGADSVDNISSQIKKWKESGGEVSSKEINDWYKTVKK